MTAHPCPSWCVRTPEEHEQEAADPIYDGAVMHQSVEWEGPGDSQLRISLLTAGSRPDEPAELLIYLEPQPDPLTPREARALAALLEDLADEAEEADRVALALEISAQPPEIRRRIIAFLKGETDRLEVNTDG